LVEQAGTTMTEVVASVKRVTDIVGEISAASQEQSQGIDEVGRAITSIDETTQQNAALVEQSAAAAQSLQDQAAKLMQLVSVFKLDQQVAGATSASARKHTAIDVTPRPVQLKQMKKPVAVAAAVPALASASRPVAATVGKDDDWEQF
ncbi:methyl-accepting chemotaxis protein, partial [Herbaspirillum lusitanum]|uniref:methyl-accepting chemotaxis protein n=1 Tax=Herbaspirillum lusitanum TaxID=213312 RepID=UPI000590E91C